MKKGKVTIHDISKALSIDSSTVSRALNDSSRVKKHTKEKIISKAKELGYQRNSLASKLRTNKTNTIGVIIPRISRHFFSSAIAGIEEAAYDAGYDVMICQSLEQENREKKLIETLLSNRVDGILISITMNTGTANYFNDFNAHGVPIVFFDRPYNVEENTNIIIDDFKISFEATEYLIQTGCKDIVHFSGPQKSELYKRRCEGYKAALEKYDMVLKDDYIIESKLMKEDGVSSAKQLLNLPKVDAVFAANDTSAIGAMQYLKTQSVKIPEEISFIGFSNEPVSAVIEPSLTTIEQPDFEMGKAAINVLFDKISNKAHRFENQTKMLAPHLIIRNSTKPKLL